MYPDNIEQLHIELTDKCQASCPMCLRNHFGGKDRAFIRNEEISLENFKEWFPPEFIKRLKNFYACGSLGDPVVAKDCLEIVKYIRSINTECRVAIHTNGSLRTVKWWGELAESLGPNGTVVFAIDGFEGEHELYRKGTSWKKIVENAKAFISAGGIARADCLVFKHNEQRLDELKEFLLSIGFVDVNLKSTNRFYSKTEFPVMNREGNIEYYIHPPESKRWATQYLNPNIKKLVDKDSLNSILEKSEIAPQCVLKKEIYVDAYGNVFPCCWTASVLIDDNDDILPEMEIVRTQLNQSRVDFMNDIGFLNLKGTNVISLLSSLDWKNKLYTHWQGRKNFNCVKSCATNLKGLIE